ncbi:MAG: tyrosine-type recombinase/integrase [Planctomycetaceae bacterium]|nr:tyrosine-type recombinase/integrase [Planctomycetaceae bacterium]
MGKSDRSENRLLFNKSRLESIAPPSTGRAVYHDEKVRGLCLQVTARDRKTFYLYKWFEGKPVKYKIGRFPGTTVETARKSAKKLLAKMADGENPQAARTAARGEMTLDMLQARWLADAKLRKKTWKEDERQYNVFLKRWGGRRLSEIDSGEVVTLHAKIGEKHGRYAANRVLALLRAMFNFALSPHESVKWKGINPTAGVRKFTEKSRDRFITPEEMPAFFHALGEEEETVRDYFWLALLTGARKSNLLEMRWDQLTVEGMWRIPETKSGEVVVLPLVQQAQNILRARRERYGHQPWVFPGPGKAGHLVEVRKAWLRICRRAGLQDLRIHDLRRTLGSWQALSGASEIIIGKSLGHAAGSKATAVYARLGVDPVRESLDVATGKMIALQNGSKEGAGDGQ